MISLTFDRQISEDGTKVVYTVGGPIFFGSIKPLMDIFPNPEEEPKDVTILFTNANIHDWSGMMAIKKLHSRFESNGAKATFQNLNVASHRLMKKGEDLWEGIEIFGKEDFNQNDPLVGVDHYEKDHPHL